MLVFDDDGEEMGDFREEEYDLTPGNTSEAECFWGAVICYCVGIAAIIGFVWWVLQVADPALDKLDAMRVK